MLDRRYIYLMRKPGSRKHKIGISNNPGRRLKAVDSHVRGDVRMITCRKVFFAGFVEKYLHDLFSDSRFIFWRAGKKAGRTEWFDLNFLERWFVIGWINFFSVMQYIVILAIIVYVFSNYNFTDLSAFSFR